MPPLPQPPRLLRHPTADRAAWLALAIGAGSAIGLIARWLGAGQHGFLAIPVLLAALWLLFADPSRCQPPRSGADDHPPRQ